MESYTFGSDEAVAAVIAALPEKFQMRLSQRVARNMVSLLLDVYLIKTEDIGWAKGMITRIVNAVWRSGVNVDPVSADINFSRADMERLVSYLVQSYNNDHSTGPWAGHHASLIAQNVGVTWI